MSDGLTGQLHIQPNPASQNVQVRFDQIFPDAAVTVTDIAGRVLLVQPMYTNDNLVSLRTLTSGSYFVNIVSRSKIVARQKLTVIK